jgi:3-oxoacyl-[acyl-carrier protein] reductase
MSSLEGKVAVITGASYGIGRAVSIGLAREGCDVVLVARGEGGLQATASRVREAGRKAVVCQADISKIDDIQRLASIVQSEFGHLDILWNGAFGWIDGPIEQNPEADLAYFVDSSVRGPILVTRALMPLLLQSSSPHIINVSADWEFPANNGISAFIAAKRAIAGLGIALAKEKWAKVKITNLHPADVASVGYDLDDPVEEVVAKTNNAKIPLRELVDLVIFVLKLDHMVVHQIDFKPIRQEIGMTFL